MAKRKPPSRKRTRGDRQRFEGKSLKPLVVFAAEGETERKYLKSLRTSRYGDRIVFAIANTGDRSSLSKFLEKIRYEENKNGGDAKGAWIVCDRDQNEAHKSKLEKWLGNSDKHYAAVSHPCIEYWLLLHLCANPSSSTAQNAEKELEKNWLWGQYKKGCNISSELIEATDRAVSCARQRRSSLGIGADAWNSPQWTDLPELIDWLDELDPKEKKR